MSISQKIRQLRKAKKVSPDILGIYVGYKGRQGIYDIESGKTQRISNEMLAKFAEFFDVPLSYFYEEYEIVEEPKLFYNPKNKIEKTVSAENMANLLEENRTLWRENAILKTVIIENKIDVTNYITK